MYEPIHYSGEEIREMGSALDDDPFDLSGVIYHPSFQVQSQTLLATQQMPPTTTTITRVPTTRNSWSGARNELGIGVVPNAGDNIDGGVEENEGDERVGKRQKKMVLHREVERQRRQDMASLHASLRSLLPLEYLKGKRSMSDHLHEAVKYISHLKARNELLRNNKDQLRALQNNNGTTCRPHTNPRYVADIDHRKDEPNKGDSLVSRRSYRSSDRVVVVNACKEGGVEVVLKVGQEDKLTLSLILKALAQRGLDVTNCICTNMGNNVWLHCLQAQAREGIIVDASKLQQELCLKS